MIKGIRQGPRLVYSTHGNTVGLHFMNSDLGQERPRFLARFNTDQLVAKFSLRYLSFTVEQIIITGSVGQIRSEGWRKVINADYMSEINKEQVLQRLVHNWD
jgi:hypothetical protein